MSTEQNKANIRRLFEEAWNGGNLAVVDELIATNCVGHGPSMVLHGPEAAKQFIAGYRTVFPDLHFTIEDLIVEGDKVVTRWSSHGTPQGTLQGIPPIGKQATSSGITISRFVAGKVEEDWINWDALGLMQHLGVIPSMGSLEANCVADRWSTCPPHEANTAGETDEYTTTDSTVHAESELILVVGRR